MSITDVNRRLVGIDASNPMGFLCALGLLNVLTDRAETVGIRPPRLSFLELRGRWRPVLGTSDEEEATTDLELFCHALRADLVAYADEPALSFATSKDGSARVPPTSAGAVHEVKAPPALMRAFFDELAEDARGQDSPGTSMATGLVSDVIIDKSKGNTKPTGFHFASGQQRMLAAAYELRNALAGTNDDLLRELVSSAVDGPWKLRSIAKSFSWDPASVRIYALRASDPSGDEKGSVPVAEWCAFRALSLLPCFPVGRRLLTTAIRPGKKGDTGVFSWPLWTSPTTRAGAVALLHAGNWGEASASARSARGVAEVWQSTIERVGQGYGQFTPSAPA